jgi:hypothetical protein
LVGNTIDGDHDPVSPVKAAPGDRIASPPASRTHEPRREMLSAPHLIGEAINTPGFRPAMPTDGWRVPSPRYRTTVDPRAAASS